MAEAQIRDQYGNPIQLTDQFGNPVKLTDEHGNPIHLTGVATTTPTTVADLIDTERATDQAGGTGQLRRSNSSSSSSSVLKHISSSYFFASFLIWWNWNLYYCLTSCVFYPIGLLR